MTKKDDISYSDALKEIELILQNIEDGKFDVDQLGEKVKRVTFLLDLCKKKLRFTEDEISKIIEGIDD